MKDLIREAYWVISVLADGGDVYKMELISLKHKLEAALEEEE